MKQIDGLNVPEIAPNDIEDMRFMYCRFILEQTDHACVAFDGGCVYCMFNEDSDIGAFKKWLKGQGFETD